MFWKNDKLFFYIHITGRVSTLNKHIVKSLMIFNNKTVLKILRSKLLIIYNTKFHQ